LTSIAAVACLAAGAATAVHKLPLSQAPQASAARVVARSRKRHRCRCGGCKLLQLLRPLLQLLWARHFTLRCCFEAPKHLLCLLLQLLLGCSINVRSMPAAQVASQRCHCRLNNIFVLKRSSHSHTELSGWQLHSFVHPVGLTRDLLIRVSVGVQPMRQHSTH
jgi:hypothetical protein